MLSPLHLEMNSGAIKLRRVSAFRRPSFGSATGGTAEPVYDKLVELHEAGEFDATNMVGFQMDEYVVQVADDLRTGVNIDPSHPQSYRYYLRNRFYDRVGASSDRWFVPDAANPGDYERQIARTEGGAIDIQLAGIGSDGHVAFCESGCDPDLLTHIEKLHPGTIRDNARFFDDPEDVPRYAITMGVATLLKYTNEFVLLAFGENKANAVFRALERTPCRDVPASWLQYHQACSSQNVVFVLDAAAASLLTPKTRTITLSDAMRMMPSLVA